MTRVLLARHAQSEHNAVQRLAGHVDSDLTDAGLDQAQQLAERLEAEDIDAVYSSPLRRARRTADIVAAPHGLEVESLTDLKERTWGVLEGHHRHRREQEMEPGETLDTYTPMDAEDLDDVRSRVFPVLDEIRTRHDADDTVVIVGHGWVNRAILTAALGAESGHGHRLKQGNTCLNELRYDTARGWRIHRVNDTTHLADYRPDQ